MKRSKGVLYGSNSRKKREKKKKKKDDVVQALPRIGPGRNGRIFPVWRKKEKKRAVEGRKKESTSPTNRTRSSRGRREVEVFKPRKAAGNEERKEGGSSARAPSSSFALGRGGQESETAVRTVIGLLRGSFQLGRKQGKKKKGSLLLLLVPRGWEGSVKRKSSCLSGRKREGPSSASQGRGKKKKRKRRARSSTKIKKRGGEGTVKRL